MRAGGELGAARAQSAGRTGVQSILPKPHGSEGEGGEGGLASLVSPCKAETSERVRRAEMLWL